MIHTYGCSFTYCSGLRPESLPGGLEGEAYLGSKKWRSYTWIKLLKKFRDEEINNRGLGGVSNGYILDRVLEDMHIFEKGDTVILGRTQDTRLMVPVGGGDARTTTYLHLMANSAELLWAKAKEGQCQYSGVNIDEEELNTLLDYYFYLQPKFEPFYQDLFDNQFNSLCSFLNKIGIKCLYWDSSTWCVFEPINTWTNNYCSDGHWSPNGHAEFAIIVDYCLKNNISYLNFDIIGKLLNIVELPDTYIRFSKDDL